MDEIRTSYKQAPKRALEVLLDENQEFIKNGQIPLPLEPPFVKQPRLHNLRPSSSQPWDINAFILANPNSAIIYLYEEKNLSQSQLRAMLLNASEIFVEVESSIVACMHRHNNIPEDVFQLLAQVKSSGEILGAIATFSNASEDMKVFAAMRRESILNN